MELKKKDITSLMSIWIHERRPYTAVEDADALLTEFDNIATEMGITHFLVHGTCIGFYLEGGYNVTDPDIDVGILCSPEKRDDLLQRLLNNDFIRNDINQDLTLGNCTFIKNGLQFDVYYGDLPMKYLKEFDTLEYKERKYNIPHPIEEYLEEQYGPDWRVQKYPGMMLPDDMTKDCDVYEVNEGYYFAGENLEGRAVFHEIPAMFILLAKKHKMIKMVSIGPADVKK